MKKLFWKNEVAAPNVPAKNPTLLFCLLMDFLGYATYALPFFGEFLDLLWAPVSALIFFRTFGGTRGFFGGVFNFVEELLPGLDFIPTFTITWAIQYFSRNKNVRTLQPLSGNYIQKV
jgi:hypothetical protein